MWSKNVDKKSPAESLKISTYFVYFVCTSTLVVCWLESGMVAGISEASVGETLHTSLDGSSVRVIWHSEFPDRNDSSLPECEFICSHRGITLPKLVSGMRYSYPADAGGFEGFLHEVWLRDVVPPGSHEVGPNQDWLVVYRCHDEPFAPWTEPQSLLLHDPHARIKNDSAIALVADMGVDFSGDTMSSMMHAHVMRTFGSLDMVVHVGDISYADDRLPSHNWKIWKKFFEDLHPFASQVLYMTAPGNHETQFNFTAYRNWLHMPFETSGSLSPDYYSFDYLGIHFAMLSTEIDFSRSSEQYQWLQADLKRANKNRKHVPWVIVAGHRPLYCSSILSRERCRVEAPLYRLYLEDLLYQERVDVYLSGHNHQYERTYPMYKGQAVAYNFSNPAAPVYIVNGGAGNIEGNDHTHLPEKDVPWRAAAGTSHTSWMTVVPTHNSLRFFYSESRDHTVLDHFEITRNAGVVP